MNKDKFRGVMLLNGDTIPKLAEYLKINESTLSRKINSYNGAEFTQGEIQAIKERYKLTPKQVDEIFFAH